MELSLFFFSVVFYGFTVAFVRIEPSGEGNLTEGDELSLSCIMEDPKFGDIDWYKGREKLSEGITSLKPNYYNLTHSSTQREGLQRFVLHVKSVTKENHGMYKCKATAADGSKVGPFKYFLNVLYKPHSRYPLCNVSISEQLAICKSEKGNPEISLQWRYQSTVFTDIETLNTDDFTHSKIAYFNWIPTPMDLDDAIVCFLDTQPERNCSISLRDVYKSFDQPTISSNMTIFATESATVSCSTTLNLTNSEFVFQYETFPHNRSLLNAQDDKSISFLEIPVGVEYIQVSCLFKWGSFDSLTSDLTFITVIQPTTTSNPLRTPREIILPFTPSILSQSSTQPRKTAISTTHYVTKHNFADFTTSEQISTDHRRQMSTSFYFQSFKTSSVPPSSFGMAQTVHVPDEVYNTSPPSSKVDSFPKDIFTTDKLTTMKYLESTPPSDIKTYEANTDQLLPVQVDPLSTVSVSTLVTKLYTKPTIVDEINSMPHTVVDTNPAENLVTDFLTTTLITTTHSITNPLDVLSTKENTSDAQGSLSTEAHGRPSHTMPHTAPSRVTSMTSTLSIATSDTAARYEITTPHQSLSSREDASLAKGTEKAPILMNGTDKTKPSINGKPNTTKDHLNNEQNGKGIAEQGTNKKDEYMYIIYIVVTICCGCTILTMTIIYLLRKKKKSREYQVDL